MPSIDPMSLASGQQSDLGPANRLKSSPNDLFIGVGVVSTVKPIYLTLVSIHKPLSIGIPVLVLVRLALRYGAPSLRASGYNDHVTVPTSGATNCRTDSSLRIVVAGSARPVHYPDKSYSSRRRGIG
jgi:hypothetical protein